MSSKVKLVGVLVLLAVAVWFGLQLMRPEAKVALAKRGRAINAVPGSVTVLAERALQVKSDVSGRIVRSNLVLSDKVAAGGVLLELDTGDLNLQIEQLENDRATIQKRIKIGSATQFELQNATEQLENSERLHKQGTVTAVDLERQRRAVKQIEQKLELENVANAQQLAKIENDLKVAHRNRSKMTVRSPVEGVVSAVLANVGDLIPAGEAVATIIADSRVIEARISEENFSGLKVGQAATLRFLSYGAIQYAGRVEKILPAADPLTKRYMVHLSAEIDPKLLVPGITGEVNIVVDARDNAVTIPRRALLGQRVFRVKDGRVELRPVVLGFASLNSVEVLSGLDAGDAVIVEGLDLFRPGDRVSVAPVQPGKELEF
ncbi:MAG: efflux RND transporter periplasmic adaptor subunit [Opitutaceae bacterium]|nr:efflux RND transporter periplasmic adaptor subunit [Opitutaceae bacterium]